MIIGDSKGVNNRHVWFGSITSSGKGCNGHYTAKTLFLFSTCWLLSSSINTEYMLDTRKAY